MTNQLDVSVQDAAEAVTGELRRHRSLAAHTQVRVFGLIDRFVQFVTAGCGAELLSEVSRDHVRQFVVAATVRTGNRPSVATMRLRRWVLRMFFRVSRELNLVSIDPTQDVALPSRISRSARPLSDDEVERCRRAALHNLASNRLTVAWALGEATARTAEIPHLRLSDLDLAAGRVWIHGSKHTTARWGTLSPWGNLHLQRRVQEFGSDPDRRRLLAYQGSGNLESRVSFSSQALRETVRRAGLAHEDRVTPASLAAWAGVRVFGENHRIEAVAVALGARSLDAAARLINWDWHPQAGGADG